MASPDPEQFVPAPMSGRVAARGVDLWRMVVVLAIALLPAACAEFYGQAVFSIGPSNGQLDFGRINFGELAGLLIFGAVVALGYEPLRLARKGTTSGKVKRDIELRVFNQPAQRCSTKRAVGRYFVSVGACGAAVSAFVAGAAAVNVTWSPWLVFVLGVVPMIAVWLSVLVSALLRADRRGWHDVLAGTVLVSTSRPSLWSPRGGGPSGDSDGGSARDGDGL